MAKVREWTLEEVTPAGECPRFYRVRERKGESGQNPDRMVLCESVYLETALESLCDAARGEIVTEKVA